MKEKLPNVFWTIMNGTKCWVMDGRYHGGKREYFNTKEKAQGRAESLYNQLFRHGADIASIPHSDLLEASHGLEILKPLGGSLIDACQFYAQHLRDKAQFTSTVEEAVQKWIDFKSRGQIRPATLINYSSKICAFRDAFLGKRLADIPQDDIHKWLHNLEGSNVTRTDYCSCLSSFFSWCVIQKWIPENPCKGISFRMIEKEVSILSIEDAKAIFDAAKVDDPDIYRYVVLCMFVGLRPESEAIRATQKDIRSVTNDIRVHSAKTGAIRYVRMEKGVCDALLRSDWKNGAYAENFRRRWDVLRYKLGFDIWLDPKYKPPHRFADVTIRKWPHDVMRHTYCSYHLAAFENEALTIHCAGHSQRMFRKHYRRPIPKSEGERFWNIIKSDH
jgi:integrase